MLYVLLVAELYFNNSLKCVVNYTCDFFYLMIYKEKSINLEKKSKAYIVTQCMLAVE